MKPITLAKLIRRGLQADGHSFERTKIQHGVQFRFECGAILNVFGTGKIQWQGAHEHRDKGIDRVISEAQRALRGPGLFGHKVG
jgi:hypothetical protein